MSFTAARRDEVVKLFREDNPVVHLSNTDFSAVEDLFKLCQCIRDGSNKTQYNMSLCKLDGSKCSHLFEAFSALRHEFSLDISYNNLGAAGVTGIAHVLAPTVRLIHLSMSGTSLGDAGVMRLVASLSSSEALRVLDLANNRIARDGMVCVASVIPKMEKLVSLNLSGNDMSDDRSVASICVAIKSSKIQVLDLSMNRIVSKSAVHIGTLVAKNRVLERLNLSCNAFGDAGMSDIGSSLVDNVVLKALNLSGTQIGPIGAARIAKCLELNDTLRDLDISRVHQSHIALGVDGALKIADMLTLNRGITTLNLYWQCIGNRGASAIAMAMDSNRTITKLNLGGNYISSEGMRSLEVALGITQNIASNTPISSWRESAPMIPLLLNRGLRNQRPSTAGPIQSRRSITAAGGTGRTHLRVNTSASLFPPARRLSQSASSPTQRTPASAPLPKPSLSRSSTMSHVTSVQRPSSAFLDNKYNGDVVPRILANRVATADDKIGEPPSPNSSGRALLPARNTPLLAASTSLVHRVKKKTGEDERAGEVDTGEAVLEAMRTMGTDVARVSEDI